MTHRISTHRTFQLLAAAGALIVAFVVMPDHVYGQGPGGRGGGQGQGQGRGNQAPATARAAAPYDPTGYWVSIISANWRLRMVTPARGDFVGIPISEAGRKLGDMWDPDKDQASGNQCKSYGAAGVMNLPERLHITWADDYTLKMDIDAGTQTRMFHFAGGPPTVTAVAAKRTLQGTSVAMWESRRGGRGAANSPARHLRVNTTNMLPGYLRKNGVPYGEGATMIEYYDIYPQGEPGGAIMLVTMDISDPVYLEQRYVVSATFKKQADATGWEPTPCDPKW